MKKTLITAAFAILGALAGVQPAMAAGYTQTKYPIVLVHGLFGFDSILGIDYWYRIPENLRADGAQVFVTQVSAANSTEVRGEQLLTQVKQILAITGASKVNLIGHSHGGPTARYISGVAPQLVASVTSVGGVNRGSDFADAVRGVLPDGSPLTSIVASTVDATLTALIQGLSGQSTLPKDANAALTSLSTAGSLAYNAKFPAGVPTSGCGNGATVVNGVRYYSWGGSTPYTNVFDPIDGPLLLTSAFFSGKANDGLVSACSMNLGQVIRTDYIMNHLDEVNQTVGLVSIWETNPVELFRQHANRLKTAGL
ncbi:MAG: lipase family alpha/beta hydrolase [Acidobacteriota bacterium]